jgi:hypothetical protein
MKIFSVNQKLITIEEWCQGKICFSEITGTNARTQKSGLGSSPNEGGLCSLETMQSRTPPTVRFLCFNEITET